jgi:hypothetical protein
METTTHSCTFGINGDEQHAPTVRNTVCSKGRLEARGCRGKVPETRHTQFSKRKEVQAAASSSGELWPGQTDQMLRARFPPSLLSTLSLPNLCRVSSLYYEIHFQSFLIHRQRCSSGVRRQVFLVCSRITYKYLTALQLRYSSAPLVSRLQSRLSKPLAQRSEL